MPDTTQPQVMISYARKDATDFAGRLASELRHHGIIAWLDTSEIEGGAEWLQSLEQGISTCKVVIAVRTPGGRESMWVRRERLYALEKRKQIIPVLQIACETDLELIDRQPVDFTHSFEMALPKLVEHIRELSNVDVPETIDRRTLELAYLGRILLEHSIWQDLYTPMAGVARMHRAKPRDVKLQIVTVPNTIGQTFREKVREQFHHEEVTETEQREYSDILPAIEQMRQLVILGDPGCGKTTTLWRIAADYAGRAKENPAAPLPVFVRLGVLRVDQTLEAQLRANLGELGVHFDGLMAEKRLVVLLDGLNELPAENRTEHARQLRILVQHCQRDNLLVAVTCRELDYTGDLDLCIPRQVRIAPLDVFRIRQFVNGYIKEPAGAGDMLFWQLAGGDEVRTAWEKWQQAGATIELFWSSTDVPRENPNVYQLTSDSLDKTWREAVHGDRSMMRLARNPYMLYMMTQVFTEETAIPQNRGKLFQLFVNFLLMEREKLALAAAEDLRTRLAELAYTMQAKGEAGTSAGRAEVLAALGSEERVYQAQSANILGGTDEIRFTHQLLQEFFAAHKLDREMQSGIPAERFWPPENWWKPTGWEETAILLAGLYNDDCTPVIEWLRDANPELAARCVQESGAHTPDETIQALQPGWMLRLTDVVRDPQPPARAAVGRATGRLKLDSRPGIGLRPDGPPDIDWVEIPAGEFVMGSNKAKDPRARNSEMPQHTVTLDTFHISRYPMTYAQYAAFVESDGYENDTYWTSDGLAWRGDKRHSEYLWNDPQWHISNHPVVGVTWYEAYAFTQWLSARLGTVVALPTESQWEKAARGTDGRTYPYGDTFDPTKGNTDPTGIGRTSTVGIFPDGASPYGVLDMSGNVWDWCLTKWRSSYAEPEDNDPQGDPRRVLRGGSWFNAQVSARAAVRADRNPDGRYDDIGFRVVCASPI